MDWLEITVVTEKEAVEAVADLFFCLGSGGVIIEDPEELQRVANSGEWDAFELPEESLQMTRPQVKGYLPCNEELPQKIEELTNELTEIMFRIGQEPCEILSYLIYLEHFGTQWN